MPALPRLLASVLAALVIVFLAIGAGLRAAEAHAFLVQTAPAAGERLGGSPSVIRMQFSQPISSLKELGLRSRDGNRVALGRPEITQGGLVVDADVPPLRSGIYLASWEVAAIDGHFSVGEFAFAVGNVSGPLPGATTGSEQVAPWPALLSHLLFIAGLLLVLGGLAAEYVILPVEARIQLGRLPIVWPLGVSAAGAIGQLTWLVISGGKGGVPLTFPDLVTQKPGLIALAELGALAYALWLLPVRRLRPLIPVPLATALATAAIAGHPGSFDPPWAPLADLVHLAAVSIWLGGLGALALLALRTHDAVLFLSAVRRYSSFALPATAVAIAGGAVVALAELTRPSDLISTSYGLVLSLKASLVAGALGLALLGRRMLYRTALANRALRLSRLVRGEAAVLGGAVLLAALLANLPAPRAAAGGVDLLGEPFPRDAVYAATLDGNLAVYLAATPDQLQARVVEPSGTSWPGSRLALNGRLPSGGQLSFFPRRCGDGCLATAFRWPPGTTTISVTAESGRWRGGTAQLDVPWPPAAGGPALLDAVVRTMRALPTVAFSEHVTSGPGTNAQDEVSLTGEQFVVQEPYSADQASGVSRWPSAFTSELLTLSLPGSYLWYSLEIDGSNRVQREVIVSPGHLIERVFRYPSG